MQSSILLSFMLAITSAAYTQHPFPKHQLSINGFRNPSIGLEYQHGHLSLHSGFYITNFTSGVTTEFFKTGLTYWFLPVDRKTNPSSFYAGASYLRGFTRNYKDKNAYAAEAGFRWFVWKGLNFRLGVIALTAEGQEMKINPTPGISYSLKF